MAKGTPSTTKNEGVVYIPSWTGYRDSELNVDKVTNFKRNAYGKGLERKQKNIIFSGKPKIKVYDKNMNNDEKLAQRLTLMFFSNKVNLQEAMIQRFEDSFWWGPSIFNQVWEKEGNEIVLKELLHMPTSSFRFAPGGAKIYNRLLQGITWNDKTGEVEIYQTVDYTSPKKLDITNFFVVLDDSDDQLVADPVITPIAPIIEMLSFAWNSEMGLVNRLGSPVFFIKITDPQPATELNGNLSDADYANLIMANWDSQQSYPLRSNMEIVVPQFGDTKVTIEVIQALQYVLIDYMSPASFIGGAGKEGALIKGSSMPEGRLMASYIKGWHQRIQKAFAPLFQRYLDANGYKGYSVELEIPAQDVEDKGLRLEQAKFGATSRTLFPNEVRELIDHEGVDDKELIRIAEQWDILAAPVVSPFGAPMSPATLTPDEEEPTTPGPEAEDEIPDDTSDPDNTPDDTVEDGDKTPADVKPAKGDKTKADKAPDAKNKFTSKGIPGRGEIARITAENITEALKQLKAEAAKAMG